MAKALLVQGLGFGDEGKGSVVSYLTQREKSPLVVRFNGGAQAGHNVVDEDDRHHCFSQFGSGTFAGARTLLSRHMLVNPLTMYPEAGHLKDLRVPGPLEHLIVERDALVTTPFHMAANRIRELLRVGRHGSCGMGIGETMTDSIARRDTAIRVGDFQDKDKLLTKLKRLQEYKLGQLLGLYSTSLRLGDETHMIIQQEMARLQNPKAIEDIVVLFQDFARDVTLVDETFLKEQLKLDQTIIFEGAQGALLDMNYGFFPHVTYSNCTWENADDLLDGSEVKPTKIGVTRSYMTRHGAGPFVTEVSAWKPPESEHNGKHAYQQSFRVGHFDAVMFRYGVDVMQEVDEIALTCMDHYEQDDKLRRICVGYNCNGERFDSTVKPGDLKIKLTPNKGFQEKLGQDLAQMSPELRVCHPPLADYVEKLTGVPVTILSYGPKASDKRKREPRA